MVLWTMLRGPSRQYIIQLFIKKNVKKESKSWTGELKNSKLKTTLDKKPWTKKGKSGLLKKNYENKKNCGKNNYGHKKNYGSKISKQKNDADQKIKKY